MCVCVCVLMLGSQSCETLHDRMDCVAPQAPLSWNSPGKNTGVDCHSHSLGDIPKPEIEPGSPALQVNSLPSEPPGKPDRMCVCVSVCVCVCVSVCVCIHPIGSIFLEDHD